ncbi:Proteasome lid subunit RPN8/RPN11, contains Jab1/MPN metalloenzyme (JAMM) motif [Alteribacillus persepolensis]|uniref:Proteasome lid subunit RPN8/RPN11, contains Jab1/MPN metalloenzyme (JAMM) motif n=2 Tax=Alteribacillus persepolensis TaxID=568899 RepID=A0A1G8IQ83_9BACI|nr:Proteasome lid subunit RPN8/RPN11, contains Jab1/MPN metalloenzyme (JAMM) motif [Alteribacillus persepolensis]
MLHHCEQTKPIEACGILSGSRKGQCEKIWKMKNMKQSKYSFEMNQNDLEKRLRLLQKNNEVLTGIYHSHPTAAPYPSKQDIANAHYPDAAYIIVSLAHSKPKVRCFRINHRTMCPMKIKLWN